MTMTTKTMMTIATTIDDGEVRDRCALSFVSWRMLARSLGVEAPAPGRAPGHRHYPRGRAATTTGSGPAACVFCAAAAARATERARRVNIEKLPPQPMPHGQLSQSASHETMSNARTPRSWPSALPLRPCCYYYYWLGASSLRILRVEPGGVTRCCLMSWNVISYSMNLSPSSLPRQHFHA